MKNMEPLSLRTKNDLLQINAKYEKNNQVLGYEIIIRITYRCNLNCEFCFVDHKTSSFSNERMDILIDELKKLDMRKNRIVLSGGEPTLHPKYFQYIDKLKETNSKIITQTNAIVFSNPKNLKSLNENNQFFISFPSPIENEYNKITDSKQFKNFLTGASNLSQNHFIELNHVIYRNNYKSFEELLCLVKERFNLYNTRLLISNLGLLNKFDHKGKLVKYSKIIKEIKGPYKKHKDEINIGFTISGGCSFPLCILKKITPLEGKDYFKANKSMISFESFTKQFYKNKKCLYCEYNSFCQGFPGIYVEKFGDEEIEPIS